MQGHLESIGHLSRVRVQGEALVHQSHHRGDDERRAGDVFRQTAQHLHMDGLQPHLFLRLAQGGRHGVGVPVDEALDEMLRQAAPTRRDHRRAHGVHVRERVRPPEGLGPGRAARRWVRPGSAAARASRASRNR